MKKLIVLMLLAIVAAVIGWGIVRRGAPPRVNFAKVRRQTLVSTLATNGKAEPFEWQAVRADSAGLVARVDVQEGQSVTQGSVIATLSDPLAESNLAAAEARVSEATAALAGAEAGGRPSDFADLDSRQARARLDLEQATKDLHTLERLAAKNAATPAEVQAAGEKARQFQLELDAIERRRNSLVAKPDVAAAQARLQDARVALNLVRQKAARLSIHAPLAGVVYGLAIRPGTYLNAGDLVTNIGRLDRLRVRVYVDEPELGRVSAGEPVTISWQAVPGKKWEGVVERKPTSIQTLGSRQVGEVLCTIENPGRELIPGTNVDAEIRTAVVNNALVIPRESLRHDAGGDFVYRLQDDTIERRPVKIGATSISQLEIVSGLADGDAVALPADISLRPGDRVTPVM